MATLKLLIALSDVKDENDQDLIDYHAEVIENDSDGDMTSATIAAAATLHNFKDNEAFVKMMTDFTERMEANVNVSGQEDKSDSPE